MQHKNPKVDAYFNHLEKWAIELNLLREILLDCLLVEELKWRQPCYMYNESNIAIIGGFKEYCVITFFKGTLLSDTDGILSEIGENTQSAKTIRFTNKEQILKIKDILQAYIIEAIEIEKAGLKVAKREPSDIIFVEELVEKLDSDPQFKEAFESLTPGRQRAYNIHFSSAKQTKTRISRIEACTPKILKRKGLNDCTCGLSKRMPNCDGSHKQLEN